MKRFFEIATLCCVLGGLSACSTTVENPKVDQRMNSESTKVACTKDCDETRTKCVASCDSDSCQGSCKTDHDQCIVTCDEEVKVMTSDAGM